MQGNAFVRERAGSNGWMQIEEYDDGSSPIVVGRKREVNKEKPPNMQSAGGSKRSAEGDLNGIEKRARLHDHATEPGETSREGDELKLRPDNGMLVVEEPKRMNARRPGDVFVAHGIRDELKAQLDVSLHKH